jgi:hypothetical protein
MSKELLKDDFRYQHIRLPKNAISASSAALASTSNRLQWRLLKPCHSGEGGVHALDAEKSWIPACAHCCPGKLA